MKITDYLKNNFTVKKTDKEKVIKEGDGENISEYFNEIRKWHKFRVIAIDDDEINLQVLENFMKMEQIEIETVVSPSELISKVKNGKYDLVLLDIMMPAMSGYDICRILREKYSQSRLPILMLTAKTKTEDIVKGFECGANDYVVKPFEREELICRIKNLLTMKYSVDLAIENIVKFEEEKYKNIYLEKIKNFENMISIAYSERNQEKALLIMTSVILIAFEEYFRSICFYSYESATNQFKQNYFIRREDISDIRSLYFENFLENMDILYNAISGKNIKNNLKTIIRGGDKGGEAFYSNNIEIIEGGNICSEGENEKYITIPVIYDIFRYGILLIKYGEGEIDDAIKTRLKIFSKGMAVYMEKQKLEKEKIEKEKSIDFRCIKCNRKLFAYRDKIRFVEIKCPKCDTINKID